MKQKALKRTRFEAKSSDVCDTKGKTLHSAEESVVKVKTLAVDSDVAANCKPLKSCLKRRKQSFESLFQSSANAAQSPATEKHMDSRGIGTVQRRQKWPNYEALKREYAQLKTKNDIQKKETTRYRSIAKKWEKHHSKLKKQYDELVERTGVLHTVKREMID